MSLSEPHTTTVHFRPGVVRGVQTWTVTPTDIRHGGDVVVRLGEIDSYSFVDVPHRGLNVAVHTLFTATGKHTIQCNLGRRDPQRGEFLTLVCAVLRQLETSKPQLRAKPPSRISTWAFFLVGAALVAAAGFFVVTALTNSNAPLFYVFAGMAAFVSVPFLLGPPPWKSGKPVTPGQTIDFIVAGQQ